MSDLQAKVETFEMRAAECELIAEVTMDSAKREHFLRLALHYRDLAADACRLIIARDVD